jgi:DNA-binding cell septation regulator SpoVG
MNTIISEVTIIPLKPNKGLVALASCVLDGKLYLGSIGIYTKLKGGYRLTYPNKKVGENAINIFHPINRETGDLIEKAIVAEYEKLFDNVIQDENIYSKQ